jgi:hypothetical protein
LVLSASGSASMLLYIGKFTAPRSPARSIARATLSRCFSQNLDTHLDVRLLAERYSVAMSHGAPS